MRASIFDGLIYTQERSNNKVNIVVHTVHIIQCELQMIETEVQRQAELFELHKACVNDPVIDYNG